MYTICVQIHVCMYVCMQVPTRNQMNAEESLEEFFEDFPALGMLGTPYQILPDTPYVIDEDAQLVSKYLRAYDIGGTKGIDRLYKEGRLLLCLHNVYELSNMHHTHANMR